MGAHAYPAVSKLGFIIEFRALRVFRVNSVPCASHRWRQPVSQGSDLNPRGQIVACQQSMARLPTAHAQPADAKLGLSPVRFGIAF